MEISIFNQSNKRNITVMFSDLITKNKKRMNDITV